MNAIYKPIGRAAEFADYALNLYTGCLHDCDYCFNKHTPWFSPGIFHDPRPRAGILDQVDIDAKKLEKKGVKERILLCFSCDPYQGTESLNHITSSALAILAAHGLRATILTKGGSKAYRDFPLMKRADIVFASSISFIDDRTAKLYEPNAMPPSDRIATIKNASCSGIKTWISLEPVIEPYQALAVIEATRRHVMEFKIGPLNHQKPTTHFSWKWFMGAAVAAADGTPIHFKQAAFKKAEEE